MFGMDLKSALKMLKGVFKTEGIKSVILFENEEGEIEMKQYNSNVREELKYLLSFPENVERIKKQRNGK